MTLRQSPLFSLCQSITTLYTPTDQVARGRLDGWCQTQLQIFISPLRNFRNLFLPQMFIRKMTAAHQTDKSLDTISKTNRVSNNLSPAQPNHQKPPHTVVRLSKDITKLLRQAYYRRIQSNQLISLSFQPLKINAELSCPKLPIGRMTHNQFSRMIVKKKMASQVQTPKRKQENSIHATEPSLALSKISVRKILNVPNTNNSRVPYFRRHLQPLRLIQHPKPELKTIKKGKGEWPKRRTSRYSKCSAWTQQQQVDSEMILV